MILKHCHFILKRKNFYKKRKRKRKQARVFMSLNKTNNGPQIQDRRRRFDFDRPKPKKQSHISITTPHGSWSGIFHSTRHFDMNHRMRLLPNIQRSGSEYAKQEKDICLSARPYSNQSKGSNSSPLFGFVLILKKEKD